MFVRDRPARLAGRPGASDEAFDETVSRPLTQHNEAAAASPYATASLGVADALGQGEMSAGAPLPAGRLARRALVVSSSWWAFPAQIAIELAARGVHVEALCPRGHPIRKTRSVGAFHPYRGSAPLRSLRQAIAASRPSLIIPCDDRSVSHLHALHGASLKTASAGDAAMRGVIETSLGDVCSFPRVERRACVIALARAAGAAAPEMVALSGVEELRRLLPSFGLPVALKVDGSWGGLGVVLAHTEEEAEAAFDSLSSRLSAVVAAKRAIVDRDSFSLQPWLQRLRPLVNMQRYAPGRPANCAVACWQGEVLACTCVEVLHARNALGASTVVRRIDNPAMRQAASALVRALGLSGLCGFDFLIDDSTGTVNLLECNARATPLCHLDFGAGSNPVAALANHVFGELETPPARRINADTVAFFPQCWLLEPDSPVLRDCYHDVPWCEPDLVRELVRTPWPERGLVARITGRTRRREIGPVWTKTADAAGTAEGASGPAGHG
jgi:hypothetical protein